MRTRPILFSEGLVREILAGRKTVTRRPVKACRQFAAWKVAPGDAYDAHMDDDGRSATFLVAGDQGFTDWIDCPCGGPGDLLYVRETWAPADRMYDSHDLDTPEVIAYRADRSALHHGCEPPRSPPAYDLASWNFDALRWRPSIHMPRWAARLWLSVTDVRIERLHGISEDDARAEGTPGRDAFAATWDAIYGRAAGFSWDADPWVWRVGFRRTKRPENAA